MIWQYILSAVIAYLLGSISTGVLLANHKGHDIRNEGSKSTGATNALRVVGVKTGLMTFVGDCVKAVIAVLVGRALGGTTGGMIAGLAVIIGHNWPLFFGFKGGKGVSCSCAVMLFMFPLEGAAAIALCALIIFLTRYVSLGSLVMFVSFAVILCITRGFWPFGVWAVIITLIGIVRHHANIQRLFSGTESKLNFQKKD